MVSPPLPMTRPTNSCGIFIRSDFWPASRLTAAGSALASSSSKSLTAALALATSMASPLIRSRVTASSGRSRPAAPSPPQGLDGLSAFFSFTSAVVACRNLKYPLRARHIAGLTFPCSGFSGRSSKPSWAPSRASTASSAFSKMHNTSVLLKCWKSTMSGSPRSSKSSSKSDFVRRSAPEMCTTSGLGSPRSALSTATSSDPSLPPPAFPASFSSILARWLRTGVVCVSSPVAPLLLSGFLGAFCFLCPFGKQ
mmetsp:Transcript_44985/g.129084  ORF Transcript_44985/g.129084 Transcript_44985/m.129084 type:complete len:253 (-) Transcript_44985:1268-2026(-)